MSKRNDHLNEIRRLRIKQYLESGYSISKTAKLLNIGYAHVRQIYEQDVKKL
jgi:transposase